MRIVHTADLHLGHQRFQRATAGGRNLREADVARSFLAFVQAVEALDPKPDLILVAGDAFDSIRPSTAALIEAFEGCARLARVAPVVMCTGNHEEPKTSATAGILPLMRQAGNVFVVERKADRLHFPALDCAVTCVPESVAHTTDLRPSSERGTNILLLHGEVADVIPGAPLSHASIEPGRLTEHRWDYVALGHYHVTTEVAPMVWYAGAIDYTSSDIWRELRTEAKQGLEGKGFLLVDTVARTVTRHNLPRSRVIVDLPAIEADGRTAEELDQEILENLAELPEGADLPVVRQVVRNVSKVVQRDMKVPHDRALRASCCNLAIDARRADVSRAVGVLRGPTATRPSLPQLLHAAIDRDVSDPAEREALKSLGTQYLEQAEEQEDARRTA